MPVTFWTFLIGSLALMGVPPLAGFWSKDEIIAAAWTSGHKWVWAAAVVTAVLTAFYVTRMLLMTFTGKYRGSAHPHESPRVMTWPLMLLAFLSATVGFLGSPQMGAVFGSWVHVPFEEHETEAFQYGLALFSVAGVALGAFIGYRLYSKWRERDPLRALGPLYTLLENKYYMDDFYMKGIVKPIQYRLSAFTNWTNQRLLDGVVNGAGRLARVLAVITEAVDRRGVDGAVNGIANATGTTGGLLKYVQSGNIQRYLALLFAGIVILTILIVRA
jgi:NADH-quinone oxidoreductase subunit L